MSEYQEAWDAAREYVIELNQPQKLDFKKDIRELREKVGTEDDFQIELGRKFTHGDFAKSEYDKLLNNSTSKQAEFRNRMVKIENIIHALDELMYEFLDNIKYVTTRLENSLPKNKHEMIDIFCENLEWKGGKACWDWKNPYYLFMKQPKNSTMLPRLDSN